jgi:uncharacterized membrane protein YeaQ/YmgE (transglycosylase-associated protein family)
MHLLIWIISGIVAGWLAGLIVGGYGFGCLGDFVVGLLGGVIGGWLFSGLGLFPGSWLGEVLVAAVGGIILVIVIRLIRRI